MKLPFTTSSKTKSAAKTKHQPKKRSMLQVVLQSRRMYYSIALIVVLAVNVNAWYQPAIAQAQYLWSRQQSIAEKEGRWDALDYDSPVNAVHAAMLKNGKVLLIAGSGNDQKQFDAGSFKTVVWDPKSGKFTDVQTPWDAFCAGHVFLPDGKLLVAGGTRLYENLDMTPQLNYAGLKDAYIFDPDTLKYEKVDSMEFARWYPTLVTLGDGKVLSAAGLDDRGQPSGGDTEVYDPATKQWTTSQNLNHVFPTYPSLILAADGRLFYSGSNSGYAPQGENSKRPGFWNLNTNNFQYVNGLSEATKTDSSASLLLPPAQDQKIMLLGGSTAGDSPATDTTARTAIIDLDSAAEPAYTDGPRLKNATRYPNAVILPDDTVLETGGSRGYRGAQGDLLSAQIYSPKTNTLTDAASPRVGRNYHAEALLLPDGRVATFGSDPLGSKFEMRIEIYSPSYLFKYNKAGKLSGQQRPSITAGPTILNRGTNSSFFVNKPAEIKTAKLMRPSAVTHVTDVEQRSVDLPFTKTKHGIDYKIPDNPNLLPPGWYMAFVTDKNDVPSIAYWVQVK